MPIIHESIHARRGWTVEYTLDLNGTAVGYASMAVAGPHHCTAAIIETRADVFIR